MSYAFQRHPRMSLRPEQHTHIAAAYDKAAFDISLPAHTRAAFARKADWFRLRARVGKKIEQAALIASEGKQAPQELLPNPFWFGVCKPTATRAGRALLQGELVLWRQSHEHVGDAH